jgi:hypothetical protein
MFKQLNSRGSNQEFGTHLKESCPLFFRSLEGPFCFAAQALAQQDWAAHQWGWLDAPHW